MRNGSFADWITSHQPQGWDVAVNVGEETLGTLVHTLPHAVRLGADPTEPASLGQDITRAKPGFCYRLEFHMRPGDEQTAQVLFNDQPVVTLNIAPTAGTGYSYYHAYTPCLPPNTTMSILFTKPDLGLVMVDDVAVSVAGACLLNAPGGD